MPPRTTLRSIRPTRFRRVERCSPHGAQRNAGGALGSARHTVLRLPSPGLQSAMVRYRRNLIAGGTFFFTVTLADRRSSVLVEHIALLRAAFRQTRRERPFAIQAIVVLPDHLHAIITLPSEDSGFSGRWRRIKGLFTRKAARSSLSIAPDERGEYDLWQRRFWEHTIRDDGDFTRHVDYIHFNPVKHGSVSRVSAWPHSLFHRYVRQRILPEDWAGDINERGDDFGER
jgi:putative transposase